MVVDAEEAEVVEEELMELVTDPIDKDNQLVEIADADGKAKGVPEFLEVGHSMEVVWPLTDMEVKDTL